MNQRPILVLYTSILEIVKNDEFRTLSLLFWTRSAGFTIFYYLLRKSLLFCLLFGTLTSRFSSKLIAVLGVRKT